jgi:hypothetical protein
VAIGIEAQPSVESGFGDQRVLWRPFDDLHYAPMHLLLLLEDLGQGKVGLLRRHQCIEGVDPPQTRPNSVAASDRNAFHRLLSWLREPPSTERVGAHFAS